jgi:double zinc ribbon protein
MLVALFGITNEGVNLFVNLVLLFLVVVWIALIAWTYLDARRRIQDPVLVACATGASLFPYVGTIVYAILRPPEFLEDARERELEIRAAQLRVRQLEEQSCPNCAYPIERTYLRCPNCRARVKEPCESCQKPIDPRWAICPYCETPQRRAAPQPRRVAEPTRRASGGEVSEKRGRRSKSTAGSESDRQPAAQGRSGQPRQARAGASRQSSGTSKRKPGSGRSTSGAQSTREGRGEDRPRPATAS